MKIATNRFYRCALRALGLVTLALSGCAQSGHEFGCPDGQIDVSGVCRETCTDTCGEGETCEGGACLPCKPGMDCSQCGDGKRTGREACDDGNQRAGDGCDACAIEENWACATDKEPSECACAPGFQDKDGDGTCEAS